MTIANGYLNFSTACLKKFASVEYVEFLLNPIEKCVAIRPCDKDNPNAIHWGKLKEECWITRKVSCKGIAGTLSSMFEWEAGMKYRFTGDYFSDGEDKMLLFQMDEPEMIKAQEVVVPLEPEGTSPEAEPSEAQTEPATKTIKKEIIIFAQKPDELFGRPVNLIHKINIAEQKHYAGNWNILCPAQVVDDLNVLNADSLDGFLAEADKIIEGWTAKL